MLFILKIRTGFAVGVFLMVCVSKCTTSRSPRYLRPSAPGGGRAQIIVGVGIPMALEPESTTVGAVLKANVVFPPWNATSTLAESLGYTRHSTLTRWTAYEMTEILFNSLQIGADGHQCLLRTICEVAALPFNRDSGLSAELLHIFLTPSSSNEVIFSQPERDYAAAERRGRTGLKGCTELKKSCPVSLLNWFSRLI